MSKKILNKVVDLLDKFSDRLARIGNQTRQNTDQVAHFEEKLTDVRKVNDDREARQIIRDQNNVQSLVNLRDSTAKAFDQVKRDVETLLQQIQRLNERVGKAESQAGIGSAAFQHMVGIENRVSKIENSESLPQGHVWVNKKLAGVYDTTDDLETRVKKLENILSLYENLRKAQAAFAEANGAFISAPKV